MGGSGILWFKNKTNLDSGAYEYKVWGNTTLGSVGVSETRYIQINNTAPGIASFQPTNVNFTIAEPSNQTFNVTFSNTDGDIITTTWYENSSEVSTHPQYNFSGGFNTNGFYNITVIISDGVETSETSWNMTVNNTNQFSSIVNISITFIYKSWMYKCYNRFI